MDLNLNRIREEVGEDLGRVDALIRDSLGSDIGVLNSVNGYVLSNSGKQLRPLLSILISRACSGGHPVEASFCYAAAAELLHNATLLHDDVADCGDCRRGEPTVRALMGPSASVLVGDFWLVRAVRLILDQGIDSAGLRVVRLFSKTLCDLAEGEMLQLQKSRTGDTGTGDYERIIYGKTASLFESAGVAAAISVGADDEVERAVGLYARSLGMAFQIRDDILDYRETSRSAGKPVGADAAEGLITLPLLCAFETVSKEMEARIREIMAKMPGRGDESEGIVAFVRENGGIERSAGRLNGFVDEAVEALDILPRSRERDSLEALARSLRQ